MIVKKPLSSGSFCSSRFLLILSLEELCFLSFLTRGVAGETFILVRGVCGGCSGLPLPPPALMLSLFPKLAFPLDVVFVVVVDVVDVVVIVDTVDGGDVAEEDLLALERLVLFLDYFHARFIIKIKDSKKI
jgi:hypothetical protein